VQAVGSRQWAVDRADEPRRGGFRHAADHHDPPDDRPGAVADKGAEWPAFGVRLLWVVDPQARSVTVHRPGVEPVVVGGDDRLDGGDVVPGFGVRVGELFE
jgi:Uma2 family endonuclease